jgi:hypothetical protein
MNEARPGREGQGEGGDDAARPDAKYRPPAIEWEEDFEPAAQATSCALFPGDCMSRPQT